jgi:hypothetical protein
VPEHQRGVDDEPPDAPVVVVVGVRAAHPDRRDPDDDLPRSGLRDGPFLDPHVAGPMEHGGAHDRRTLERG